VPASIFYSRLFSIVLLALHISSATFFIRNVPRPVTSYNIFSLLTTTLFSGIAFSRSLHYSFYIWYFHTVPFLLRLAGLSIPLRFVVALVLEFAWNQWQSYKEHDEFNSCATWWGSATMFVVHMFILGRLLYTIGVQRDKKDRVLG